MKLIIGLGNPGEKYTGTRHNLGFEVLDEYARKLSGSEIVWGMENKFKAEVLKIGDTMLVKPQTFMNNSGMAVKLLVNYFKVPLQEVIVLHDELDLPLGKIKIRLGGAAAGHHGVESVITSLGSDAFIRVRLGIGPSSGRTVLSEHKMDSFNVEHFVLEPFMPGERPKVKQIYKRGVEAIKTLLDKGLEVAQNQYN